jgi:Tol biopolymer transport system component
MAQPFDPQKLELAGEPVPIADQGGEPESGAGIRPFSISENGVLAYPSNWTFSENRQMVWYDRAGKRLGTVGEPVGYGRPRISPNQKQLAVDRAGRGTLFEAVWLFDQTRNTKSRFTFHPGINGFPIWSPDGSRIVFTSNWEGSFNLYQKAVSGTGSEELLLKPSSNAWARDWSRDGQFIVYEENGPTKSTIWVLPLEGDRKPFLFEQTDSSESGGAFSPDGRWLAYMSNESGKSEVYVQTFTGKRGAAASGRKWLISTSGGTLPRWRGDGKELFYRAPDGKVMAVDIGSGASLEAGAPKELFDAQGMGYDVTADGQRFIVTTPVEGAQVRSSITVVLNWQAALKK